MPWVKLDDSMPDHPKVIGLSDAALAMHIRGLCYCAKHLTDGFVPSNVLRLLGKNGAARELVSGGLWIATDRGWVIHDFLVYQKSRADVEAERAKNRWRQELANDHALRAQIRARDGNTCRYCGEDVSWTDRRGPRGATYDHVDPRGENVFENIVVACRGCNAAKGPRRPEQAGLTLRPAPGKSESKPKSESESESGSHLGAVVPDPARPGPTHHQIDTDTSDRAPSDGRALWARIIEELELTERNRKEFFDPCEVDSYEPGRLVINARKSFIGEWLNQHFWKRVREVASAIEPGLRVDLITKSLAMRAG